MSSKALHPDVLEFVSILHQLEAILDEHEKAFWATKISRVRQVAEKSDGYSVTLFEELFGGMGSFNDLILDASDSANKEFSAIRIRAYELAQALK